MYFSSKITISVVSYLADKGVTADSLFEMSDLVFVKESNYWLDANKVEAFLTALEEKFGAELAPEGLLVTEVAHCSHQLRSWGVLDSVLRMMPDPSDIYAQPQRFISYFISPPPPIDNLQSSGQSVSFQLPILKEEFPLTTSYISATLESLPQFTGNDRAYVTWKENRIDISWAKVDVKQVAKVQKKNQMNQLLLKVSDAEKKLEQKSEELLGKKCEITELQYELTEIQNQTKDSDELAGEEWLDFAHRALQKSLMQVQGKMLQLNDYLTRSQQLVTLLVGQDRMNPQVKEAMRRVDWEQIQSRSSVVLEEGLGSLLHMQTSLKELKSLDLELSSPQENKVFMDVNEMVMRVAEKVQSLSSQTVEFETSLELSDQVEVFPESMERALYQVLKDVWAHKKKGPAVLHLSTRLNGERAEIEFVDTGAAFYSMAPKRRRYMGVANSLVKMHNGTLNCKKIEGGSTCIIDLPIGTTLGRNIDRSDIRV